MPYWTETDWSPLYISRSAARILVALAELRKAGAYVVHCEYAGKYVKDNFEECCEELISKGMLESLEGSRLAITGHGCWGATLVDKYREETEAIRTYRDP